MNETIYRLKRYPRALVELITGKTDTYHNRCGSEISFNNVTEGYYAQCPECDEDLFKFETYTDEDAN